MDEWITQDCLGHQRDKLTTADLAANLIADLYSDASRLASSKPNCFSIFCLIRRGVSSLVRKRSLVNKIKMSMLSMTWIFLWTNFKVPFFLAAHTSFFAAFSSSIIGGICISAVLVGQVTVELRVRCHIYHISITWCDKTCTNLVISRQCCALENQLRNVLAWDWPTKHENYIKKKESKNQFNDNDDRDTGVGLCKKNRGENQMCKGNPVKNV